MTKTNSVRTIWAIRKTFMERRSSVCADRMPGAPVRLQRAAPFLDVRFVLVPEVLDRRQHRRYGRVAERTQRLAGNVSRNAEQQVEIAHLPATALDLLQHFVQPVGPFAARRALAARLVAIEMEQVLGEPDHAGRVDEH